MESAPSLAYGADALYPVKGVLAWCCGFADCTWHEAVKGLGGRAHGLGGTVSNRCPVVPRLADSRVGMQGLGSRGGMHGLHGSCDCPPCRTTAGSHP